MPTLSPLFQTRKPSSVRVAQQLFSQRTDGVVAINAAVGNVKQPMHPRMIATMQTLQDANSPFAGGVVAYSESSGTKSAQAAFLHIIASSGFDTTGLQALVVDGGSQAMEMIVVGLAGDGADRPLLMFDPVYSNYRSFAQRTGRKVVSLPRDLQPDGSFSFPSRQIIEEAIQTHKPSAIVVIPYDNPSGQKMSLAELQMLAEVCVAHDLWLVSDEAYRELSYTDQPSDNSNATPTSIWAFNESSVPGITGRRASIETASKVWNACGLRIGALVTDSPELYQAALAEQTINLCAPVIDQHIFASLLEESHQDLQKWYHLQRSFYGQRLKHVAAKLKELEPNLLISQPAAALYLVVDFKQTAPAGFTTTAFAQYLASQGSSNLNGRPTTLLLAPMAGFYDSNNYIQPDGSNTNPGQMQIRLAVVCPDAELEVLPQLLVDLYRQYLAQLS